MALETFPRHESFRDGRFAGHPFIGDRPVRHDDGVEGNGTDVDDEQLVDHVFAGVGVFITVGVDPFPAVYDRLACGEMDTAIAARRQSSELENINNG